MACPSWPSRLHHPNTLSTAFLERFLASACYSRFPALSSLLIRCVSLLASPLPCLKLPGLLQTPSCPVHRATVLSSPRSLQSRTLKSVAGSWLGRRNEQYRRLRAVFRFSWRSSAFYTNNSVIHGEDVGQRYPENRPPAQTLGGSLPSASPEENLSVDTIYAFSVERIFTLRDKTFEFFANRISAVAAFARGIFRSCRGPRNFGRNMCAAVGLRRSFRNDREELVLPLGRSASFIRELL